MKMYGHERREDIMIGIRKVLDVDIAGIVGEGRPCLEWRQAVEKDVSKMGLLLEDVLDRPRW